MPAFLVTLDRSKGGRTLPDGADAMVIFAADATQAKQMAAAKYDGDGSSWASNSTATEIAVAADWAGWTFKVTILGGFGSGGADSASVTVLADATTNTMDEVGAALATALNALDGIAGAAYTAVSNTLKIAETTDALGDQQVVVTITPPNGKSGIASLVGTIVDGGAEADVLSVVLPADNAVVPKTYSAVRQV